MAAGLTAQHVVDDDPTICQLLTRYFEGEGYIVSTAFDGQEMRRHLKQNEVDIVLLDVFRLSVLRS
ncbi:response regulator [Neorhizobium sp. T25_13]|uniref:response regulator n=1 Tax=Neorhizobium sp. T25_13 TaxID=2093830 RepID=UPI00352B0ED5